MDFWNASDWVELQSVDADHVTAIYVSGDLHGTPQLKGVQMQESRDFSEPKYCCSFLDREQIGIFGLRKNQNGLLETYPAAIGYPSAMPETPYTSLLHSYDEADHSALHRFQRR